MGGSGSILSRIGVELGTFPVEADVFNRESLAPHLT